MLTVDSPVPGDEKRKSPERVKRSLFNVPLFTNMSALMKACPYLLNYVCSITQSTSAIAQFSRSCFPQLCLRREGKIHILSFFLFCTKHLMKRDYRDVNMSVIVVTLRIHNQCFEAATCDKLCSFKWNKSCTVDEKESEVEYQT